ncbi:hypothetical protein ZIOFF_067554 [Zingiber officinale]|uniref:Uncharacterized protein n=1 Tax=Zingiber officinale TaxID=94328 RepID=A0A8J5C6K8_ZINOF|nr:hypothetical protein ZIOFF_067554 [Zingiber officinale]
MAAHFPAPSPITSPDIVGRPTLWFAWCRSGTDQSSRRLRLGRRRSSKLPATPCSFGSPLASSEFESNWRERKLLDWIWVFDRWWCLQFKNGEKMGLFCWILPGKVLVTEAKLPALIYMGFSVLRVCIIASRTFGDTVMRDCGTLTNGQKQSAVL